MEVQRYIIVDWGIELIQKYVEIKNKAWRKLELLRETKLQEKSLKSFLIHSYHPVGSWMSVGVSWGTEGIQSYKKNSFSEYGSYKLLDWIRASYCEYVLNLFPNHKLQFRIQEGVCEDSKKVFICIYLHPLTIFSPIS